MNRREFIERTSAAAGAAIVVGVTGVRAQTDPRTIGIQVGAVSFLDEGTDQVLDRFAEMAAINTLFLATFTYGRGIGGRMPRGTPLPDHGTQEYDDNYHGGNFATPHPQYYRHTSIAPQKAPDHPDYDVIADVVPRARARGMKVICWYEDVFRKDVPGLDKAFEVDVHGKPAARVCYRISGRAGRGRRLLPDHAALLAIIVGRRSRAASRRSPAPGPSTATCTGGSSG